MSTETDRLNEECEQMSARIQVLQAESDTFRRERYAALAEAAAAKREAQELRSMLSEKCVEMAKALAEKHEDKANKLQSGGYFPDAVQHRGIAAGVMVLSDALVARLFPDPGDAPAPSVPTPRANILDDDEAMTAVATLKARGFTAEQVLALVFGGTANESAWETNAASRTAEPVKSPTINSDNENVAHVAAALADAVHAGGLSADYYRTADAALKRLASEVRSMDGGSVPTPDERVDILARIESLDAAAKRLPLGAEYGVEFRHASMFNVATDVVRYMRGERSELLDDVIAIASRGGPSVVAKEPGRLPAAPAETEGPMRPWDYPGYWED